MKNYYQLLELDPSASGDEIKRAFHLQIARYHPDKVQHLGKEFQEMAAGRAAELTEAYRVLSKTSSRAEYDRLLASLGDADSAAPSAWAAPPAAEPKPQTRTPQAGQETAASRAPFSEERGRRDEFVRKAALGRLHRALEQALGTAFEQPQVRGFDVAVVPKPKLFGRSRDTRLLVRFVPVVDAYAVGEAWIAAAKWGAAGREPVCVLLMGTAVAPAAELGAAIVEQRRKPARGAQVTLVPIDARDWAAHLPIDTPPLARQLLERLQKQH